MNNIQIIKTRGVAIVEFALLLPLLLMILVGVIEIGRALYQENTLYKAVESGARYLSRLEGYIADPATSCVPANKVTDEQAAINLIMYGNHTGGTTTLIPNITAGNITIDTGTDPVIIDEGSYTITACVIKVSAQVPFAGLFGTVIPFTSIVVPFDITAETEERYIGY